MIVEDLRGRVFGPLEFSRRYKIKIYQHIKLEKLQYCFKYNSILFTIYSFDMHNQFIIH